MFDVYYSHNSHMWTIGCLGILGHIGWMLDLGMLVYPFPGFYFYNCQNLKLGLIAKVSKYNLSAIGQWAVYFHFLSEKVSLYRIHHFLFDIADSWRGDRAVRHNIQMKKSSITEGRPIGNVNLRLPKKYTLFKHKDKTRRLLLTCSTCSLFSSSFSWVLLTWSWHPRTYNSVNGLYL